MFDSLPEGFRPFLGPEYAVCKIEVPTQRIGFEWGSSVVCEFCVAEIRGQDPDRPDAG